MFFNPLPAASVLDLINYSKDHLQADYKVEMPPTPTKIAGRPFTFFAYWSPVAQLHWYVMATEIRCHAVQMILSSRDTKLLENLVLDLNKMKLTAEAGPAGGGAVPVCIKGYANETNVIARVDPVFTDHKFNSVPGPHHHRQDGKSETHSFSQRVSRSGEGHHRRPGAVAVQALPPGRAAGRGGNGINVRASAASGGGRSGHNDRIVPGEIWIFAAMIRFVVHSGGTVIPPHASHHGVVAHRE